MSDEPIVSARAYLEQDLSHLGIEWGEARLDRPVLLALPQILSRLEKAGAVSDAGHPYFSEMKETGGLHLMRARIGSPAIATQVEEISVLGATAIVHLGFAGGLDPDLDFGAAVVSSGAINETGTALIYGHEIDAVVPADAPLSKRLADRLDVALTLHWCTDAPLMETWEKVERYRAMGAACVEMEAGGIFAPAAGHGVPASAVYLITDRLTPEGWDQGWRHPGLLDGIANLVEAVPDLQAII